MIQILVGDALTKLRELPDESVHCCVTSPPYYGLRDYGHDGQIGLEASPQEFIDKLVAVFREVRRVLRKDGTCWVNMGDSYASGGRASRDPGQSKIHPSYEGENFVDGLRPADPPGVKPKDLLGIPWMLAFALRADGWYLRQDIIWSKPNPMPESVTDRCTKAHEYIFLLSKSERYFYDQKAIRVPAKPSSVARVSQDVASQEGSDRVPGKTNGKMKAVKFGGNKLCPDTRLQSGKEWHPTQGGSGFTPDKRNTDASGDFSANRKSVWEVPTCGFKDAHFATFPPALIEPCILAGCPSDGTVLDPFGGAGTTGLVADRLGRNAILIELNPAYAAMARNRITADSPLFAEVS